MRSPEEQEDFLKHGRFGEGTHTVTRRPKIDKVLWIGLAFLAASGALLGSAIVFRIGRDDGGPFFLMGFIAASAVGVVLCVWGLARMRSH
jgi:hypothetical protein